MTDTEYAYKLIAKAKGDAKLISEIISIAKLHESHSLEEIGDMLGISRERTRQIEKQALNKLKHPRVALKLKRYIEDYTQEDKCVF